MLSSFRAYRAAWVPSDLIAGLMLAAIAMPEQLATARLAGFPPEAGLIAFACGSLVYVLLGRNPFLSVGADSTITPIFAGGIAALGASGGNALVFASAVAVGSGVLLVIAGLARAGWIADLLSRPITTGFLAGIGVHIIIGQLPALLGLAGRRDRWLPAELASIVRDLGHSNPYALALGLGVLIVTAGAARLNERIPGALIGLIAAALAYALGGLQAHGVAVIGTLHFQLPPPSLPLPQATSNALDGIELAFVIAAVCVMQTSAVIRSFPPTAERLPDPSGDFTAVGVGSIVSGLFGSFAVDASPPRTAIVAQSGGHSQLGSLFAVAVIVTLAASFPGFSEYVPEAALSGVLIFVGLRIIRVADMAQVARFSRREFNLLLTCTFLVVALPIQQGMLLAIVISLSHGIFLVMRPSATKLVHVANSTLWWPPSPDTPGTEVPGVLVFAPTAPLNFTNADYIHERLHEAIEGAPHPVKLVVIEASGVTDFDFTGSQSAQRVIHELRAKGIDLAVARLISEHAQRRARASGLLAVLGEDHLFHTVQDAVDALGPQNTPA